MKQHLGLTAVRVAAPTPGGYNPQTQGVLILAVFSLSLLSLVNRISGPLIQTVAICAGAGSSVLKGVKADLYLTGEMSHHDVLLAVANGTVTLGSLMYELS